MGTKLVIGGLTAPIGIADPDDGSGRLFILEQQKSTDERSFIEEQMLQMRFNLPLTHVEGEGLQQHLSQNTASSKSVDRYLGLETN